MQEGTYEARIVTWLIVTASMTQGARTGEIKMASEMSHCSVLCCYFHTNTCLDLCMLITEIIMKDK